MIKEKGKGFLTQTETSGIVMRTNYSSDGEFSITESSVLIFVFAINLPYFVINVTRVFINRNILSDRKFQNFKNEIFSKCTQISMYWLIFVLFLLGPASLPRAKELTFKILQSQQIVTKIPMFWVKKLIGVSYANMSIVTIC